LEYVKDTTPPTAKVKEATQNKVVIEFNEPATRDGYSGDEAALTRDYFYHTYSSWKPTKVVASDNNKVYTLYFSEDQKDGDYPVYLLPVGNVTGNKNFTLIQFLGMVELRIFTSGKANNIHTIFFSLNHNIILIYSFHIRIPKRTTST